MKTCIDLTNTFLKLLTLTIKLSRNMFKFMLNLASSWPSYEFTTWLCKNKHKKFTFTNLIGIKFSNDNSLWRARRQWAGVKHLLIKFRLKTEWIRLFIQWALHLDRNSYLKYLEPLKYSSQSYNGIMYCFLIEALYHFLI